MLATHDLSILTPAKAFEHVLRTRFGAYGPTGKCVSRLETLFPSELVDGLREILQIRNRYCHDCDMSWFTKEVLSDYWKLAERVRQLLNAEVRLLERDKSKYFASLCVGHPSVFEGGFCDCENIVCEAEFAFYDGRMSA